MLLHNYFIAKMRNVIVVLRFIPLNNIFFSHRYIFLSTNIYKEKIENYQYENKHVWN